MRIRFLTFLFLSLISCLACSKVHAQLLIGHKTLGIDSLSLNQVRGVFSMRLKEWPSGTPVTVFVLPDENPVHQDFIENLLQMMPYQLRRYWDRSTYTGFGQPPIEVATIEEMLERVKETPGAIGYIDTARDTEHVAIIAIH